MNRYRNILIIYKAACGSARQLSMEIDAWLRGRQISTLVLESSAMPQDACKAADCAFVLGGDGTILGVARKLIGAGIPIFGINFGRVGFLTSAEREEWLPMLERVLGGQIPLRHCLALRWRLRRAGDLAAKGVAINDLVVSGGSLARLISLGIKINNEDMGLLRCDGVILATPLGSSGYTISAGGPLLAPAMEAMALTAICPFVTNIAPLVFPGDAVFSISLHSGDAWLTIDGQEGAKLEPGDIVEVEGWRNAVSFLASERHFFARLRARGFSLEKLEPGDSACANPLSR